MESGYIALAIPAFFVLMGVESWIAKRKGQKLYRLSDSLNNLSCGILQRLAMLLCTVLLLVGYLAIYERWAFAELPADSAGVWIACFIGVDFFYYWYHRLSHEINFMWAAHVVHHQSEEYNLSVALRQSVLQPFHSMVFYWPLALIGFPPAVLAGCSAVNTLYQFWIHTRTIDRLGPFESILMTPSHHRVHHGRNPIYLDRNHGATFILWDKLFGTFQPEEEEVAYGVTKPLATWNPVWANFDYWADLLALARRSSRFTDRMRVFVAPPGWRPQELGGFEEPSPIPVPPPLYDPPVPLHLRRYASAQFIQLLGLSAPFLLMADSASWMATALGCVAASWGLLGVGAVLDGRNWAGACEWSRIVATPILLIPITQGYPLQPLLVAFLLNLGVAAYLGVYWDGLRGEARSESFGERS
ncbi:MAG: sterol desaturase [Deltaproteobacteria bacterium]|nr:sterol desaturase [Deltaproteobacteria bacterium]